MINALYFLRIKFEGWKPISKLLHFEEKSLADVRARRRSVSANLAFRLAKLVGVGVDDLIAGRWPEPGRARGAATGTSGQLVRCKEACLHEKLSITQLQRGEEADEHAGGTGLGDPRRRPRAIRRVVGRRRER